MMDLSHLDRSQLEQLRKDPNIGAVLLEKIDARLAVLPRNGIPAGISSCNKTETPKSTDPRSRMNKTEARYADVLDARVRSGEIVKWWFDDMTFRVGVDRTSYRPDFVAQLPDGSLEIDEVKGGHIWDDSKVKFKAAAREYPFARWRMRQWNRGEWKILYDFKG